MRKIFSLLILILFLSGCATSDWNRAWGTYYNAICPICKNNIGVYDTTSNFQCIYCKNVISAPEAIRLYQRYANVPSDIVTCPHCFINQDLRFLDNPSAQVIKCIYCGKDFDKAEGKKIFVQIKMQYEIIANQQAQQQMIMEEQANRAVSDRIHNIYQRSADRQQQNIQTFQKNINPLGSRTNPVYIKTDDD